jgi:hypothetical protein
LINAAININRVIIKNVNLPSAADEFAEEFAEIQVGSYVDFFSGYNQLELDIISRDMTAIQIIFRLLRQTTVL